MHKIIIPCRCYFTAALKIFALDTDRFEFASSTSSNISLQEKRSEVVLSFLSPLPFFVGCNTGMNWSFGCCNHHHRHPVFLHGKNCSFDRTMLDRYGPHWSSTRAINSAGRLFRWVQACNVCFKFWGFGRYLVICIPVIEM